MALMRHGNQVLYAGPTVVDITSSDGTVDVITSGRNQFDLSIGNSLAGKQDKLTPGDGILIDSDNVISCPGGGSGGGVFRFTPGTTTFSDVYAALEAGKTFVLVYAQPSGALLKTYYIGVTSNTLNGVSRIVLVNTSQTNLTFYTVDDSDNWTGSTTVSLDSSGKVAVDSDGVAGYLKDVLVSASDIISLVPQGNRLVVNVNLDYTSDPKLKTMDEAVIDGSSSNYGAYQLREGVDRLVWGDEVGESYNWINAQLYQCMRESDAQGSITQCHVALCGSFAFENPKPCLNVGIFDLQGNLLGQTGLKFQGTDFSTDQELAFFDMVEETEGSLSIRRNTPYIVQVWTCGLQLAALDRSTQYNYTYDAVLRQNLEGTVNAPKFVPTDLMTNRASVIPFVSFGAEPLNP